MLRVRSYVQKLVCVSLINKKLNSLISMFFQLHVMKRVEENILLANILWAWFCLGQLQQQHFLEIMLLHVKIAICAQGLF